MFINIIVRVMIKVRPCNINVILVYSISNHSFSFNIIIMGAYTCRTSSINIVRKRLILLHIVRLQYNIILWHKKDIISMETTD